MTVFAMLSMSQTSYAVQDNTTSSLMQQNEIVVDNLSITATDRAYMKIRSIYDDPHKLKQMGKLDNVIKISRRAYLDCLVETETNYLHQNITASIVLRDLENLKKMNDAINTLSQEKYGSAFTDFELIIACRRLMPKAGEILAQHGVKLDDAFILNDIFFLPVAMKVIEGEIFQLKANNAKPVEVLDREIVLLDYYSALGYSQEAITLGTNILMPAEKYLKNDRNKILGIMNVLNEEYYALGKFSESEKIIRSKLDYIAKNPKDEKSDLSDNLSANNDLIRLYLNKEMYLEAIKLLNDILPLAQSLPDDHPVKCKVLLSSCMILDSQGLYEKANDLYQRIPDNTLDMSMDKLRVMGDMVRNKIFYGFALTDDLMMFMTDMSLLGGNHHVTLTDLCNLSGDYLKIGNTTDAIAVADKAGKLSLERYGQLHPVTIKAKLALAKAYRHKGETEKSFLIDTEAYKDSVALFGENSAQTIRASLAIAADYAAMGKYSEAIKKYEDGIISYRQNYGSTNDDLPWTAMNRLAELCIIKENYKDALALCNDIRKTKRNFQSRLTPEDTATLLTMARAYRLLGNLDQAAEYYDKTLISFEGTRRHSLITDDYLSEWFAGIVPVYKEQILTYLNNNQSPQEILKLIDLCKARNLADRYNEYQALEKSDIDNVDAQTVRNFSVSISELDEAMNDARQEGNESLYISLEIVKLRMMLDEHSFKRSLSKKYPAYRIARDINLSDTTTLAEKLNAIPKDTYYIDYTILPDKIFITLAKQGEVLQALPITINNEFLQQCEIYRQILSVSNIDEFQERYGYLYKRNDDSYEVLSTLKEDGLIKDRHEFNIVSENLSITLGNVLLRPLAEYIPVNANNLIICPDGVLSNIPFETLSYGSGILLDKADVSYVPSLSVLKLMNERGEKNKAILSRSDLFAVGGVDYGRYNVKKTKSADFFPLTRGNTEEFTSVITKMENLKWNLLPNTEEEVNNAAMLFPDSSEILTGIYASERNLKELDKKGELKKYRYLLFSTHGIYVPPKPELSSILLRPDDKQIEGRYEYNGYITVGEWMSYHLNSDLVYLSACESGLGKFQAGEGIVGIPYGLTVAGNKNTIMSLWNIGDQFAAHFTSKFFAKLSQGKSIKSALNETKRECRVNRKYNHPSFWSAFLLYGE